MCGANLLQPAQATNFSSTTCNKAGYADLQCSIGYHGNLCGVCDLGHGATDPFTCRKCMSRSTLLGLYVLAALMLLAFIKLLCHFTLVETIRLESARSFEQVNPGVQSPGKADRVTDLTKPLVLYFQYLLIIATLNIDWPASVSSPLKALELVFSSSSPQTFSVDCLFSHEAGLPLAIKKIIFYLLAPFVMLAALLVLDLVIHRLSLSSKKPLSAADQVISNAIVVIFFFLPSLARTSLSMFACVTIDQLGASSTDTGLTAVGKYWLLDPQQACFEGYHFRWALGLGFPLLILICIALPAAVYFITRRSGTNSLQKPGFSLHYGFLYRTYRPNRCCWEAVIALQTVSFVTVSVFGASLGSLNQTVLMSFMLVVLEALLVKFKPYAVEEAQLIMQYAVLCLLLTTLAALTFLPNGYVQGAATNHIYQLVMGALLAALNLAFVAYVVWQLWKLVPWSHIGAKAQSVAQQAMCILGIKGSKDLRLSGRLSIGRSGSLPPQESVASVAKDTAVVV